MVKVMALFVFVPVLLLMGCENSETSTLRSSSAASPVAGTPAEYAKGEALFNAKCAPCHGPGAQGTNHGPSFLSKIYEPNHHSDISFHRAVQQGVQAHHWKFGNMPKVEGVSEQDVNEIVGYVRWLQRQAGIF
ncbi:MAG: cytochrome c [Nitrospira sp.]|nr:cytochrome c [Nitrospira sp.]